MTVDIQGVLPAGSLVRGVVEFSGGLWIDGTVHGELKGRGAATALLVVGPKALVVGNIDADVVIVFGEVQGDICARKSLEVPASGRIDGGTVSYRDIQIEEGAVVRCEMHVLAADSAALDDGSAGREPPARPAHLP
jgi:cytoskeletal protein CcmA (bactofilin family)